MGLPSSPYKVLDLSEVQTLRRYAADLNLRVVQCHGVFDLLHPGHIRHLNAAAALGDVLFVTLTHDAHVNKGPGRPHHTILDRAFQVSALECVNHAVIVSHPGTKEAIHAIRPHIFCKGPDYESKDMSEDEQAVREVGGEIRILGERPESSSAIINQLAPDSPVKAFCRSLAQHCSPAQFQAAVESFKDLKVLVIGEGIKDEYIFGRVQGLTSKNRVVSIHAKSGDACLYDGGAWAVANHVRQFTGQIARNIGDAVRKRRYVEHTNEGRELTKLFAVTTEEILPQFIDISDVPWADVVMVLDYGHGFLHEKTRRMIEANAQFLVLNCQTNSANFGYNLISKRWKRADAFALDEQELTLDAGDRDIDLRGGLASLKAYFGAKYAWLTRGPVETLGLGPPGEASICPPFETNPIDTVGAGDAFLSVAGLAAAKGLPIDLATFMGQLAGAQAVKIVGNEHPISKAQLIRTGMAMLA